MARTDRFSFAAAHKPPRDPKKAPRTLGSGRKIRVWEWVSGDKTGRVRTFTRTQALQEIKRELAVDQLPNDLLLWPSREVPLA